MPSTSGTGTLAGMGGKAAIVTGLVAGALAGGILVGSVLLLTPGPAAPVPSPVATATEAPDASPSPPAMPSSGAPSPGTSVAPGEAFGVGEAAPPLTVPGLGGGDISLAALKGKPVWVNFMATWCEPCRDEIPRMNAFAARYADQDLVVVAVDVREDEAAVDAFARELSIGFPVGLDSTGAAQQDWGAIALPVHFWIDTEGIVRYGALGGIGPDIMAEGLQTILPGVTVTP
jgi:thiol-disulfide isomerase/thioredoxin